MGYKNATRCSKSPLFLIQYFKFWNPSVYCLSNQRSSVEM